jgi:hypothetical protein
VIYHINIYFLSVDQIRAKNTGTAASYGPNFPDSPSKRQKNLVALDKSSR